MSIRFRVYGTPAPQGSKVRTRWGMREASTRLLPWREAIIGQIVRDGLDQTRCSGPVAVRATFWFERPKAHYGRRGGQPYLRENAPIYKTTAPDTDKLQRSLGDALTQGGVIVDDDLIVVWHAEKRYCDLLGRPGVTVEVIPLD